MIVWRHALLSLSLAAAGCHLVLGYGPGSTGDRTPAVDLALSEGRTDRRGDWPLRVVDRGADRPRLRDSGPVGGEVPPPKTDAAGLGPLWHAGWDGMTSDSINAILPAGVNLFIVGVTVSGPVAVLPGDLKVTLGPEALVAKCSAGDTLGAYLYTLIKPLAPGTYTLTVAPPSGITKLYVVASAWSSAGGPKPTTCRIKVTNQSVTTPIEPLQVDILALPPGATQVTHGPSQFVIDGDPGWIAYGSYARNMALSWSWKTGVVASHAVVPIAP